MGDTDDTQPIVTPRIRARAMALDVACGTQCQPLPSAREKVLWLLIGFARADYRSGWEYGSVSNLSSIQEMCLLRAEQILAACDIPTSHESKQEIAVLAGRWMAEDMAMGTRRADSSTFDVVRRTRN